MKQNKTKKTLVLVIVAVLLVALTTFAYFKLGPKGTAGSKEITVTVDHLIGEDTSFKITTNEEFLRGALEKEKLIKGDESEYGLFVKTVDGETADDSKEQWWGYSVNGEFSQNGVDTQPVKDGDKYEFKLNEGYN